MCINKTSFTAYVAYRESHKKTYTMPMPNELCSTISEAAVIGHTAPVNKIKIFEKDLEYSASGSRSHTCMMSPDELLFGTGHKAVPADVWHIPNSRFRSGRSRIIVGFMNNSIVNTPQSYVDAMIWSSLLRNMTSSLVKVAGLAVRRYCCDVTIRVWSLDWMLRQILLELF